MPCLVTGTKLRFRGRGLFKNDKVGAHVFASTSFIRRCLCSFRRDRFRRRHVPQTLSYGVNFRRDFNGKHCFVVKGVGGLASAGVVDRFGHPLPKHDFAVEFECMFGWRVGGRWAGGRVGGGMFFMTTVFTTLYLGSYSGGSPSGPVTKNSKGVLLAATLPGTANVSKAICVRLVSRPMLNGAVTAGGGGNVGIPFNDSCPVVVNRRICIFPDCRLAVSGGRLVGCHHAGKVLRERKDLRLPTGGDTGGLIGLSSAGTCLSLTKLKLVCVFGPRAVRGAKRVGLASLNVRSGGPSVKVVVRHSKCIFTNLDRVIKN